MSLYSLSKVAEVTGLPLRKIRSWADDGVLNYLQPRPHMERLVDRAELQRLESEVGLRINWKALAISAISADSATSANLVSSDSDAQS